jgi:hypothetical protein
MMTQPAISNPPATRQATESIWSLRSMLVSITLIASFTALVMASIAHAGTYAIDNCPSAPTPNGDPGPWVIFGGGQQSKASCSAGAGDWIGPRGASMSPNSFDGVQVTVPAGSTVTIREARVWWSVPHQTSGADNFAIAYANGGEVGASKTPPEWTSAPDVIVLPSTTTTLKVTDYCSNDDAGQPCNFASLSPNLQLYGSQLTLADSRLPSGKVTGGGLTSTGAISGTQSLAYEAEDIDTGVRLARLLIDGQQVTTNDYLADCPYTNFLACPASESDTINWNTATVTDGQHNIQAVVQNAAQNTSTFYDTTITTHNAPINTSIPMIITPQLVVGTALSTEPGDWTAPNGAGSITYSYDWEDCDAQGNNCQAIPGARNANYTPAPSDIGHTLRVIVTATDNDGSSSATSSASSVVLASSNSLGALPGPGTGSAPGPSASTAAGVAGVGAPNGTPAVETAVLHLGIASKVSKPFAKRALKITGRLTNTAGNPIAGASLDVLQQIAGSSTLQLVKHAKTSSGGAFSVSVPAGPSRRIEIAYRAFTGDPAYTTTATVVETVSAGVLLSIAPHNTNPTGTIVLKGRVSGPIPRQGAIIELLVHYHGEWVPLHVSLRTNRHGSFHVAYKFQGAVGRFPIWAKVPSGQAGFPYGRGSSNIINVTTR